LINNTYRQTLHKVLEVENIEKFNREILNLFPAYNYATSQPNNYTRRLQPWFNIRIFFNLKSDQIFFRGKNSNSKII
jgi:hypothetical protein